MRMPPITAETSDRQRLFELSELGFVAFDSLVDLVYSGTQETVPWTRLLDRLRELLGANYVTLILRAPQADQPLQVVFSGKAQPALAASFYTDWNAIDPFVNLPRNRMVTLEDLVDDVEWLAGSYYREFHAPLDVRYHMAADIGMGAEPTCRLRVSRPHGSERFGARERAICNLLLPHLATAVQLRASFDIAEVERFFYAGMLDRLSVGAVFLDRDGRILKTNAAASELLAQRDGLSIVNGGLSAAYPGENHELRRLIEQVVSPGGKLRPGVVGGMSVSRSSGRPSLGVAVRAAPPTEWSEPSSRPAALVIIRDPEARVVASNEQLKRLYGLTPAEANLALHLMEGRTVDEAAQRLNVSRNTARCQIRAIFAKTGVTRQTELLRVLLSGVAPLV
jgi:DNA-binding CsgD family transcriptional regulator